MFSWKLKGEHDTVFSDDTVVCWESEIGDSDLEADELVVSEVKGEYFLCNTGFTTLAVFMTGWDLTSSCFI